jgi:hypothetical protein
MKKTDLQSVFYAPYGVSILDNDGTLNLVDLETATAEYITNVEGDFAAYCGMVVDTAFLQGKELIGAVKTQTGYLFVVSDGISGFVYDENGFRLFEVPVNRTSKAFFTLNSMVISSQHITAAVYDIKTGDFINLLEPGMHLESLTPVGENIVSKYRTIDGRQFGLLLDMGYEPIASLPKLADVAGDMLIFDCSGILRKSRIYTIEELIVIAAEF